MTVSLLVRRGCPNAISFAIGWPRPVRLAGLHLRDLPLIRREWDPANRLDPDTIAATHYKDELGWICFEDDSHTFRQTVLARCSRLNSCPRCQRLRGAAAQRRVTEREHLHRIRAAWGDYDMPRPPLVTTATVSRGVPDDEDF